MKIVKNSSNCTFCSAVVLCVIVVSLGFDLLSASLLFNKIAQRLLMVGMICSSEFVDKIKNVPDVGSSSVLRIEFAEFLFNRSACSMKITLLFAIFGDF